MSATGHRQEAERSVRCAIVTLSDTRTAADDAGGALLRDLLTNAGHEVVDARILKDEPALLRAHLESLAQSGRADALLTTGGTGITARDSTFEALSALFEKRLDGFGELFRMLSYADVGAAAMLSRATAGTYRGMIVVALPGAPDAVQLALEKLVLPELAHMVYLARGNPAGPEGHHHHHHHHHSDGRQSHDVVLTVDRGSLTASATKVHVSETGAPPPMGTIAKVAEAIRYVPEKMQKYNLFASAQLFCDVYSLLEGQAQKPHVHDEADKIYYVVEGEGMFFLGDGELPAKAGDVVHAPAGVAHGVRNDGPEPLALLVVMAPNPTPPAK